MPQDRSEDRMLHVADERPDAFDVLVATPVPFAWADGEASLRAERPLIDVDGRGRIREVRFNNRSMQPLRLPYDDVVGFYAAYRAFAEIVMRPELLLTFRLEPGDCLIFDNVRLLHARTAFRAGLCAEAMFSVVDRSAISFSP